MESTEKPDEMTTMKVGMNLLKKVFDLVSSEHNFLVETNRSLRDLAAIVFELEKRVLEIERKVK